MAKLEKPFEIDGVTYLHPYAVPDAYSVGVEIVRPVAELIEDHDKDCGWIGCSSD